MPVSIATLPAIDLDYTNRGPGLYPGLARLRAYMEERREGFLLVNVQANGGVIVPVVMSRADLYVLGFRCGATWYRFSDAAWDFTEGATSLGHDGQYSSLGGLDFALTPGAINGLARLANAGQRAHWREALRTLLIVVAECSRLIPVQMQVLGLLNGISASVEIGPLARYIQNWSKASKGTDMSVQVGENLKVGFSQPTIIRR